METLISWLVLGLLAAALMFGLSCLYALPVMLLWNWLMPIIFGLPAITFWQALGLSLLAGLLFKSHGSNSSDN